MAACNPNRGEVSLPFGDGALVLRCSYAALGKLLPLLLDAPRDVQEMRREWLAASLEQFGEDAAPPPVERMEWHHHVVGAVLAREVDTVAAAIAICAEEHHPDLTPADVKRESPQWGAVYRAFFDLARLTNWRPGEEPGAEAVKTADPFALARLLSALTRRRRPAASPPPNSGA